MKNRRSFLATVAGGGVGLALAKPDVAAAQALPSPAPSGSAKPPSAGASAVAATMRTFDASLSDAELQTIAKGIDGNSDAAQTLNPKKKRLKNADAPVVHFAVDGGEA